MLDGKRSTCLSGVSDYASEKGGNSQESVPLIPAAIKLWFLGSVSAIELPIKDLELRNVTAHIWDAFGGAGFAWRVRARKGGYQIRIWTRWLRFPGSGVRPSFALASTMNVPSAWVRTLRQVNNTLSYTPCKFFAMVTDGKMACPNLFSRSCLVYK